MAESKKKSQGSHAAARVSMPANPPPVSSVWITSPDGTTPVKCCFTVSGTADPGSYIRVGISEIDGSAIRDPHPCYVWTDDSGHWSAYICVPTPPSIAAGVVVRVRACVIDLVTGHDTYCMDVPVTLGCDCPPTPAPINT